MGRQKHLTVDLQHDSRSWTLKLSVADPTVRAELIELIRDVAKRYGLTILNARDPFGAERTDKGKKRVRKPKLALPELKAG